MAILDKEEFQRWRDHPLTGEYLDLLRKRHLALTEAWGRGVPMAPEQQAQAQLLGRMAEVSFDDIRDLAGLEPLDEET